jgi:uncharacterized protein YbjT (DUF2867 family)
METSTILVVGASGFLGNEICRQLRAKNMPVKAMVRATTDPAKIEQLTKLGVQVFQGDILNRETLYKAMQGVKTVISTVSSMPFSYKPGENDIQRVDEDGMINLIDACKSTEVNHFIYTSFSKNINLDFPLRNAKRKIEKYLQRSGLTYTILRPSYFMEVWFSAATGFDALKGIVNICGTGTNPVAYISIKDVAKFAVESISNPSSNNTTLELGGPQNISPLDAVKIFEDALHHKIEVQHIPMEMLQTQFNSSTDAMQKSFSGLMLCVAFGDQIDMMEVLGNFPIKLTSVKDYINTVLQKQPSRVE